MRELIVTQNITLDGVIDAAEGWFDPAGEEEVDQSDVVETLREQMATTDALLVGRVTFEQLRGYWPRQRDDVTGVRDHLNQVDKYVVSRTLQDPAWEQGHRRDREHVADAGADRRWRGRRVPAVRLPGRPGARPAAVRRRHQRAQAPPGRDPAIPLRRRAAPLPRRRRPGPAGMISDPGDHPFVERARH
jgi:hypothetical protein